MRNAVRLGLFVLLASPLPGVASAIAATENPTIASLSMSGSPFALDLPPLVPLQVPLTTTPP